MDTINLLHDLTNAMKQLQNENADLRNQIDTFKSQLEQVNQKMDHEKECREALQEKLKEQKARLEKWRRDYRQHAY